MDPASTIGNATNTKFLNLYHVFLKILDKSGTLNGNISMTRPEELPGMTLLSPTPTKNTSTRTTMYIATAGFHPTNKETAPRMTAVLALHGISVISVLAMVLSLIVVRTRVPIIAGTLHPAPATSGIIALP